LHVVPLAVVDGTTWTNRPCGFGPFFLSRRRRYSQYRRADSRTPSLSQKIRWLSPLCSNFPTSPTQYSRLRCPAFCFLITRRVSLGAWLRASGRRLNGYADLT